MGGGAGGTRGLSCYTANLHAYLAAEWDAGALLRRSIRLAVRADLPDGLLAFSHHEPPLDRLPDGSSLRYAGARTPRAALPALAGEVEGQGRVLVVVDAARLAWSVARGAPPAPHWLLVDGRRGDRWHAADRFSALLPAGEQRAHCGWLGEEELCDAMTLPPRWEPEQELRNALVFGSPVAVPAGGALWLRRCRDRVAPPTGAQGRWLFGDARALPFLSAYLAAEGARAARHLDDLWAAAGHRSFAYRSLLAACPDREREHALAGALERWDDLPRVLRFALESAERGRPRAGLIRTTLETLLRAEEALA
jgi:hypothetical protein